MTRLKRATKRCGIVATVSLLLFTTTACEREPELHLHYPPPNSNYLLELVLKAEGSFDEYAPTWRDEWKYGWDDTDTGIFGTIDYTYPVDYQLRRYYQGTNATGTTLNTYGDRVTGGTYQGYFETGFWNLMAWNEVLTSDGVQSIIINESDAGAVAYTGQTMRSTRYEEPKFTRSFYQPESLFAGTLDGLEVNPKVGDYVYDEKRDLYIRRVEMPVKPVTYIYLTQVILHHNNGKVTSTSGQANLSGMARSIDMRTGYGGADAVTVDYNVRMKKGIDLGDEKVDIVGGRLMTFGLCNINASRVNGTSTEGVDDGVKHYLDVNLMFSNGNDSTLVFDVTQQVRRKYRGGVITIDLDMDNVPIPGRKGGSGFNAWVDEWEEIHKEIPL